MARVLQAPRWRSARLLLKGELFTAGCLKLHDYISTPLQRRSLRYVSCTWLALPACCYCWRLPKSKARAVVETQASAEPQHIFSEEDPSCTFDDLATKFVDESLATAVGLVNMDLRQEYRQVVLLGCGMDTRPYRYVHLSDATIPPPFVKRRQA